MSCECGEVEKPHHPKEKCIHLREAEDRAKAGFRDDHPVESTEKDAAHLFAVAEEQGCCCHHGGKCTCAMLRKDLEKDNSATPPRGPAVKPRLEPTKSEGSITVFQNGHHKPVHRKNHAAHECGMPYKMPMPRAHTDQNVSAKARRSVDSLALDHNTPFDSMASTVQSSVPFNTNRRMSKSEQPSPKMSGIDNPYPTFGNAKLNMIDFNNLEPLQTDQVQSAISDNYSFTPLEPLSAMADSQFDPWSALPSSESTGMPNNNPFGVWPTNNDTIGIAQPALTAASSGTHSEIDEVPPMDESYGFGMPSIQEDTGSFNFNSSMGPNSPQANRRSLPPNFFKSSDFMLPDLGGDWQQAQVSGFTNPADSAQKPFDSSQTMSYDDVWQMPTFPPMTDLPHRQLGGLPITTGRPASQSVGPSSAPNDDVIRQLFPDFVDNDVFGSANTAQGFSDGAKSMPSVNATSAPMDFGPMDENIGFTSQSWTDGSMSVPNDGFTTPYNLDQDFSNPDFTGNWSQ